MAQCREPNEREAASFLTFVRQGKNPAHAADLASEPHAGERLTASAFTRHAKKWQDFAEDYVEAKADRRAKRVAFVEDKLEENVKIAMNPENYQGAVANRSLELIGKAAGMFGDTSQVEVAVTHSGTITHERGLTLADLAEYARTLDGPIHRDLEGVPVARELLAAPAARVVAASGDAAG